MAVSLKISDGPEVHSFLGTLFLAKKCGIGFGKTPFNSSSILTALMICLGTILVFFICLEHSPESSKTSAVKYSMTAAVKMADSSLTIIPPFFCPFPVLLRCKLRKQLGVRPFLQPSSLLRLLELGWPFPFHPRFVLGSCWLVALFRPLGRRFFLLLVVLLAFFYLDSS